MEAFESFVKRTRTTLKELEYAEYEMEPIMAKTIELTSIYEGYKDSSKLPTYKAIINNKILWSVLGMHEKQIKKTIKTEREENKLRIIYPKSSELRIEHTLHHKEVYLKETKFTETNIAGWLIVDSILAFYVALLTPLISLTISLIAILLIFLIITPIMIIKTPPQKIIDQVTIEKIRIGGKRRIVEEFLKEFTQTLAKTRFNPIQKINKQTLEKLKVNPERILELWKNIGYKTNKKQKT